MRGKTGRREQKKMFVRQGITEAAFQLFLDRGMSGVTIDDIVTMAGVSRRTFYRYFSSASDVLKAWDSDITERLRQAVTDRPADEPPMVAARNALFTVVAIYQAEQDRTITLVRLIREVVGVGGQMSELTEEWIRGLARGIAARPSMAEAPLVAELTAHVVMGVAQGATSHWIRQGAEGDFLQCLRTAFNTADKLCAEAVIASVAGSGWSSVLAPQPASAS